MEKGPFQKFEEFFLQFKQLHFKKREIILRAEENPPGVLYLKEGYVRLYAICKEGEELTLIIFKPEDFFPYMWAINGTPNLYYLEAMTPVTICSAPREKFLAFLRANPDVFFELTNRILVRLGGLLARMEYLVFGNAYEKVASILLICAERFGLPAGRQGEKEIIVQVPLTHKDVANLLGLTRETTSIEIKKLERKGLITYRGRHPVVKNMERLKKESLLDGAAFTS